MGPTVFGTLDLGMGNTVDPSSFYLELNLGLAMSQVDRLGFGLKQVQILLKLSGL